MGVEATSKVVTGANKPSKARSIHPGNQDWVLIIEGIGAAGFTIPPFIILSAKRHQNLWYHGLPTGYKIGVSNNGWTTDKLGFQWLQHFDQFTKTRTAGTHRLLIVDGHSSHATPQFDQYCTEHKIITLCMPAHSSHRLQPLDVGCFSPLKTVYRAKISNIAGLGVEYVDKQEFLYSYRTIRDQVYTPVNIQSGFRATGLVPFNPERVLSELPVVRTPSESPPAEVAWTTETPHNLHQLERQARLIHDQLRRDSESPSRAVAQLVKGCQLAMHAASLLKTENDALRQQVTRRRQQRSKRRLFIQDGGSLDAVEGQALSAEAERVASEKDERRTARANRPPNKCGICREPGHNRSTCSRRQRD
jgi:hypothetical protein